tara:strand:+ start:20995 stop:21354 length:360 start_codon:yes stop_codon:yes gene_type:complete
LLVHAAAAKAVSQRVWLDMLGGFIPAGWVFAFKPLPLPQACCMRRVCHGRALVPNIRVVAVVAGSATKEVGGDIHGGKLVVTPSSGGGRRGRKERAAVTQEQWSDGKVRKQMGITKRQR